jgi:hypothetical protein
MIHFFRFGVRAIVMGADPKARQPRLSSLPDSIFAGMCPIIQVIISLMLILSKGGIIMAIAITGPA